MLAPLVIGVEPDGLKSFRGVTSGEGGCRSSWVLEGLQVCPLDPSGLRVHAPGDGEGERRGGGERAQREEETRGPTVDIANEFGPALGEWRGASQMSQWEKDEGMNGGGAGGRG